MCASNRWKLEFYLFPSFFLLNLLNEDSEELIVPPCEWARFVRLDRIPFVLSESWRKHNKLPHLARQNSSDTHARTLAHTVSTPEPSPETFKRPAASGQTCWRQMLPLRRRCDVLKGFWAENLDFLKLDTKPNRELALAWMLSSFKEYCTEHFYW